MFCFAALDFFPLKSFKNTLITKAEQIELIGLCFLSKELKGSRKYFPFD